VKLQLLASSSLLTLALCGCVLAPHLEPQAKPVDGTQLGLEGPAAVKTSDGWWKTYNDPQLDRLIGDAFTGNPNLAIALARVRSAQAKVQAASADTQPGFSLDGTEVYQRYPETYLVPPPYAGAHYWQGNVGLNLNWDLDFFGRMAAVIEQNRSATKAAALDIEATKHVLAGSIAQAYVALDQSYVLADLARRTEEQRQNILDLTIQRLKAGLDTRSELRAAEATVPQARMERLQAEANVDLAVHRLAALTGRGADTYADIQRPQLDLQTALTLPEKLPIDLLQRRPDILAARARVDAAIHGEAAAKAAFYPDINLSAFAGFAAIGLDQLFRAEDRTYGAGPTFHLPVFDAQRLKASYRNSAAEADAAIASYNQTVLQAVQQVADQLTLLASYRQQIIESDQSLAASEDANRIAELRYRNGLNGYLNVLNTETAVLNARRSKIDLIAAQAVARVTLLLAVGGSFDPDSLNALNGAHS
jgi:NodT family efflux transporter outer membrane factor (OMF) lipoprotein